MANDYKLAEPEYTDFKYVLRCRVKIHRKQVNDIGRTYERLMVYLIPELNDQGVKFLRAWLPAVKTEFYELVGLVKSPVNSTSRFAVRRGPSEDCENHHLVVMSEGVVQRILKGCRDGATIYIETFPKGMETEYEPDSSEDASEGNFQGMS